MMRKSAVPEQLVKYTGSGSPFRFNKKVGSYLFTKAGISRNSSPSSLFFSLASSDMMSSLSIDFLNFAAPALRMR
ncbi:hypothetical protein ASE26_07150 [Duganella sp. Root198D2]|nr:hypothetical protein ASD07_22950 [Duganella sp. Root336D2]KRB87168.1 hypothetical protein ASE26_07150 [Duganella sp. Root198D2]